MFLYYLLLFTFVLAMVRVYKGKTLTHNTNMYIKRYECSFYYFFIYIKVHNKFKYYIIREYLPMCVLKTVYYLLITVNEDIVYMYGCVVVCIIIYYLCMRCAFVCIFYLLLHNNCYANYSIVAECLCVCASLMQKFK